MELRIKRMMKQKQRRSRSKHCRQQRGLRLHSDGQCARSKLKSENKYEKRQPLTQTYSTASSALGVMLYGRERVRHTLIKRHFLCPSDIDWCAHPRVLKHRTTESLQGQPAGSRKDPSLRPVHHWAFAAWLAIRLKGWEPVLWR